jgi:hypothetical protein
VRGRRTPRINPGDPPKRIERRETLGPPVSWSWVQAHRPRAKRKLRRDAGNRRGAGTRSRCSGKQESVGTHRGRASRRAARQAVEGRPSLEQIVEPAGADDGGSSLRRTGCYGRRGEARKRPHAPQAGLGETSFASETVRRHHAESSQKRHGAWLCPASQGAGSGRLKRPLDHAQACRVTGTTKGTSGRSSIFSSRGDSSS